ncbi:MAG: thioredoxin-disulfide reductase [Planctomycetes bacterium]|nr:thioredoxin-disulfide reductase [Planctomycetota bacterium]
MAEKVIIIGSGPAGLTAAIYTARANLRPLCFTGMLPGGQLMLTTEVENYPGFPHGRMGPELMADFRAQAERFGASMKDTRVNRVDFTRPPFRVWADGEEDPFEAKAVIISTGASSRMLNLPGENELIGRGLSTCATCDGFFFRGKEIAVVGGGDSAMEEATFLTKFASRVTVIHRRDSLRASKILQDRARANPKIAFRWNSIPVAYKQEGGRLKGVRLVDTAAGKESDLALDGLFIAIGHIPNTEIFKGLIDLDENGYIKVVPGTSRTHREGVFACGDCQDHVYRQAVTAAGTGCMAAIDCERWLAAKGE